MVTGAATVEVRRATATGARAKLVADARRPPLVMADGTLEALKWTAALLMVLDHTNKYLYHEMLPGVFQMGRTVMPIFAFVLAYNLARPEALARGVHTRMTGRLAFWGVLASPMTLMLNGSLVNAPAWWPLNILFTLLCIVTLIRLIEQGGSKPLAAAAAVFLIAGALVEFLWFGLACGVSAWGYCRKPTPFRRLLWILGTASLSIVNGNTWALAALPLLMYASGVRIPVPRLRWAFYALYPMHLLALLTIVNVKGG